MFRVRLTSRLLDVRVHHSLLLTYLTGRTNGYHLIRLGVAGENLEPFQSPKAHDGNVLIRQRRQKQLWNRGSRRMELKELNKESRLNKHNPRFHQDREGQRRDKRHP